MKGAMGPVKNLKILFIIALIAALVILVKFSGVSFAKVQSFEIEDKCGKFINLFSHSIADQETCSLRCKSLCTSKGIGFQKADFREMENACNDCTCFCR